MWTHKQALAISGFSRVWIVWYILAIRTWQKDINNVLSNVQSTSSFIYGYLLTFLTWRLSFTIIPVYYLLLLDWTQLGYFFFGVQSCTFIIQFYTMDISITLYTGLFLVPLSNQVVDREVSKTILLGPKEVRGSARYCGDSENSFATIRLSRHYSFCWGETTLLFLIHQQNVF